MYLKFQVKIPAFIESIIVYFLLRYRKKHYGLAFRRVKLITDKDVDIKYQYAIVDPEDYQKLAGHNWLLCKNDSRNYYAVRLEGKNLVRMHRVIMNAPKGKIVDHRNHEGLDNTKRNLRFATHSQNVCNSRRTKKKESSKYRGVSWITRYKKWRAYIYYDGKYKCLGYFDNEEEAARAYDEAAKKYHREFATLNFPQVSAKPLAKTDGEFAVLNFNDDSKKEQKSRKIVEQVNKTNLLDPAPLSIKINKERCGVDVNILCCIILLLCIFTKVTAETDMIKINELRKRFGPIVAVDGVSFEVEKGQVLGFLGPNGAGKSTVMRMLACFLRPDSGTAQICGFDILKNPIEVRQNVGYLAENVPAYNEMTVGAFLSFICDVRALAGQKRKEALDKVVSMCHIESVYHQTIETLSKGYKRRVGLAQALIHDPLVLILDEPTDGLDPNQKHEVRNLISKMAKDKCIVVSTHILEEVEAVCDRAIIIARGKILADSTPEKLKTEYHGTLDEVFRKITKVA